MEIGLSNGTPRALQGHSKGSPRAFQRYFSTWALKEYLATQALKTLGHLGTRPFETLGHSKGTWALRNSKHLGPWAFRYLDSRALQRRELGLSSIWVLRHLGTRVLRHLKVTISAGLIMGLWRENRLYR